MKSFIPCAAIAVLTACGSSPDEAIRPTANAGFDARTKLGAQAQLDGSASDADVTYAWTLAQIPDRSVAVLAGATTATPTLAPDVVGPYMVALVVTRQGLASEPDVVIIDAYDNAPISAPACAGACNVTHGRNSGLDGSASSDPDSDPITYQWTQVASADQCAAACPNLTTCAPGSAIAAIANADAAVATFTAPNVVGQDLVFALTVSDGASASSACVVYATVDAAPSVALAPSAGTTNPASIGENQVFTLSAAGSSDPDGDSISYDWTQIGSSYVALISNPTNQATTVTAPNISAAPGSLPYVDLTFALTVSDGLETSSTTITVRITNTS